MPPLLPRCSYVLCPLQYIYSVVDIKFGRFISLKRQTLSLVALSLQEPRRLPTIKSRRARLPPQTCRRRVAPPTMMIQRKRYHYLSNPSRMTVIPIAKQKSRSRHRRNGEAPPPSRKTTRAKKAQKHDLSVEQCPMRGSGYDFRFLIPFLFYRLI